MVTPTVEALNPFSSFVSLATDIKHAEKRSRGLNQDQKMQITQNESKCGLDE